MEEKTLEERIYSPCLQKMVENYTVNQLSDRELKVTELDNGIILPPRESSSRARTYEGGVCDENFNFVAGLVNSPTNKAQRYVWTSYSVDEEELEYVDETVVFGGVLLNHPGHLSRDCLAQRMWWYVQNPDSDYKIAVIMIWEHGMWGEGFAKEFLELLGVPDEKLLIIRKPTKFKKILVPDQCFYIFGDRTKEFITVVDKILENVEAGPYEKVYFSKKKTLRQDMINEDYFEDFFRKHGYKIVVPEEHSMREKISMLKGAKEFATINGTNSIYSIFCSPDVRLIILERCQSDANTTPLMIDARKIKDWYSVNISLTFLSTHFSESIKLFGATNEWKRFVKDIFNEDIEDSDIGLNKSIYYDYLYRCAEYYSIPMMFERFQLADHFSIVNDMSEIFLGKTLDPDNYNIERISDYKNQVAAFKEQLTISRSANRAQNDLSQRLVAALLDKLSAKADIGPAEKEKLMRCTFRPTLTYQLHAGGKWSPKVSDEEIAGADGSKKPMISLIINNIDCGAHIFYSVYTSEEGWTIDSREGKKAGAIKKALPVKGIRVRLDDDTAEYYSVRYRVFTHPKGWTAWVADGAATPRRSCKMIDAVQIQIVQKDGYVKKAEALYDKYLSEIDSALSDGDRLAEDSAKRGLEAEMLALKNKADAQEYVIKSLEQAIATLINNKKSED